MRLRWRWPDGCVTTPAAGAPSRAPAVGVRADAAAQRRGLSRTVGSSGARSGAPS
jgi:hypothetical protein